MKHFVMVLCVCHALGITHERLVDVQELPQRIVCITNECTNEIEFTQLRLTFLEMFAISCDQIYKLFYKTGQNML